jgi:DNA-binding SARP family transcriptional activator
MLSYLLLADGLEVPRERLSGLLWSETEEQKARGSLRHAILEAQTALRSAGLVDLKADKLRLAIDRSLIDVDLWDVVEAAKQARVHPLLLERARITDSIMAGFETVDPAYGGWLVEVRETWNARLVDHLERALPREDAARIDANAEAVARALRLLDPARESAARVLIRARWAAGRRGDCAQDLRGALAASRRKLRR